MLRSTLRRLLRRAPSAASEPVNPPFTKHINGFESYSIGDFTYGAPRVLSWGEDATLRIGKFCSISAEVTIFLGGEHRTDWTSTYPFTQMFNLPLRVSGHPWTRGDVVIGNDVWIGLGATIRSGVHVGDGAVIGAHALVVSNVEPYAIVAGNPARRVRNRFSDEVIRDLAQLKWWDWSIERIKAAVPHLMSDDIAGLLALAGKGTGDDKSPEGTHVDR